jgi:putative sigma-54 modulation protein
MNITFTARHFKARPELQQFAEDSITGLTQLYDGIVGADIVLEEQAKGAGDKIAEVSLLVYKDKLFAKEKTEDFTKSINACVDKLERQLKKYKEKLHEGQHPHGRVETVVSDENL